MKQFLPTINTIFLLFILVVTINPIGSGDIFWHLEHGRQIIDNNNFLYTDIFSHTAYGNFWFAHSWLSEIIFYLFYKYLNITGLMLLFSALICFISYNSILKPITRCRLPFILYLTFSLITAWHLGISFHLRPYLFTIIFVSFLYNKLRSFLKKNEILNKDILILTFFNILWVNLHAGAVFAPVITGVCFLISLIIKKRSEIQKKLFWLTLALTASLAVNPSHIKFYGYVLQYMGSSYHKSSIAEWFSPNFHEFLIFEIYIFLFIISAMFIPKKKFFFELVISFIFLHFAFQSIRNIFLFVILSNPIICSYLKIVKFSIRKRSPKILRPFNSMILIASKVKYELSFVILFILLYSWILSFQQLPWYLENRICFNKDLFPMRLIDIVTIKLNKNDIILNDYFIGGFLIFFSEKKVFIDGRADMYGEDIMKEYLDVTRGNKNWENIIEKYSITALILNKRSVLSKILKHHNRWIKTSVISNYEIFRLKK